MAKKWAEIKKKAEPTLGTEAAIGQNGLISQLALSPHGELWRYIMTCAPAARENPEFFGRLLGWNLKKGEIRDSQAALPVIALAVSTDEELKENAEAYLASLNPRSFLQALEFAKWPYAGVTSVSVSAGTPILKVPQRRMRRLTERYLHDFEMQFPAKRTPIALRHRDVLRRLYTLTHTKPNEWANSVVVQGVNPPGSAFEALANLKRMPALEAAGAIQHFKLPFQAVAASLGNRPQKETDLALAIINLMTPTQLTSHTKMLERWGITTNPALRAAYEDGLKRAAESKKKGATLKVQRAVEALQESDDSDVNQTLIAKLNAVQEQKLQQISVEGDWLVLADKSGSMEACIDTARVVAGLLAKAAKGRVMLVFFDTAPTGYDVTGKTYEEIKQLTRFVKAAGGTSIGCGLRWAQAQGFAADGVAVVTDGGENSHPYYGQVYQEYVKATGKSPATYYYHVGPDRYADAAAFKSVATTYNVDLQIFKLGQTVDYYSLPNIVQTMRTNRYSLIDEIMGYPLLRLDDVLKRTAATELVSA